MDKYTQGCTYIFLFTSKYKKYAYSSHTHMKLLRLRIFCFKYTNYPHITQPLRQLYVLIISIPINGFIFTCYAVINWIYIGNLHWHFIWISIYTNAKHFTYTMMQHQSMGKTFGICTNKDPNTHHFNHIPVNEHTYTSLHV